MAQALPPPNWDEVSQPSNTLSTNVAPVPNTAPIVQGQVLADLQASIAALQGLPDAMKQFAAELTTLEAQFTTLNEKVTTLTENVNANTASLLALSNTVTENVNTVTAIAWKVEAADIRARNRRVGPGGHITQIPPHPDQPAQWPAGTVYPESRNAIVAMTHIQLDMILEQYQLPAGGTTDEKQRRLMLFICDTMEVTV